MNVPTINGHHPVTCRTQSIKDAMVGNMINPSIKPTRTASPTYQCVSWSRLRSETLKRFIQTDHLVAQFRGLFVPGRSPILLATGQIAHLLIDCPGERIKLLARGRSGEVHR